MQIRLSVKAREQVKPPALADSDLTAENRYCEWCVDMFTAERKKYFLVCNAYSLFGVCFPAAGITSAEKFSGRFISELKTYLDQKGLSAVFTTYIEEFTGKTGFYKTYNLRVRSAMNVLKQFLVFACRSGNSQEEINDGICGYLTSVFSDKKDYQEPKDLFISEDMKKPAVPAVPAVKAEREDVPAVQFYIELNDFTPKLWRRFVIRQDAKITTLAYAILAMFKASGGHLFNFEVTQTEFHGDYMARVSKSPFLKNTDVADLPFTMLESQSPATLIELPDPYDDALDGMKRIDARKIRVGKAFEPPQTKCLFTYDFGDNWEFELKQEKIIADGTLTALKPVKVLDGENYGIIDDCGGPGGLEDLIKAFKKGSGKQYKELKAWFGEEQFDFTAFDMKEINSSLVSDMKMYKSNYEDMQW
jgi:hypothetical protein